MCNFYRGGKKVAILLVWTLMSLAGCSPKVVTQEVPIPVTNTRTEYKMQVVHDTLRLHTRDSVFVLQKGDTVYYHHYNTIVERGSTVRVDTCYKTDTISKPITITKTEVKTVEKKLSKWQKMRLGLGDLVLAMLAAGIAYGLLYCLRKRK